MIAVTYNDASSFLVEGSYETEFPPTLVLLLDMGTDGVLNTAVTQSVYDSDAGATVVTVESSALTANLVSVVTGWDYGDEGSGITNSFAHTHKSRVSGGEQPFGALDDAAKVTRLNFISAVSVEVANGLIGVNTNGTDIIRYYVVGTENQITVDQSSVFITLSLPQSIATTSSPTFVTETLTGLEGVVVAGTGGLLTAYLPSTATDVFQGDYSWVAPTLNWLVDVVLNNLQHDDVLHYKANLGHWVNEPANYETSPAARVTIGTILALMED